MPVVETLTPETASQEAKTLLDAIQKKMGKIPNIFKNMANSPAALQAYLDLSKASNATSFPPALREQIALVVGQANNCHYCLSAHSAIGKTVGLTDEEILKARKGQSKTAKDQAILHFAKEMIDKKGLLSKEEVDQLKKSGVSDKELVELILLITVNIFTNYFNHITDPVIDFPIVPKNP